MKPFHYIFICALAIFTSRSTLADDKVLPWDALNTEKSFRSAVESRFPELHFGFYHWTDGLIIGALQDFDKHRILLVIGSGGTGKVTIERNGKALALPTGNPETVKVFKSIVPEGELENPENVSEQLIGYWIDLESTDSFTYKASLTSPIEGEFEASYSPDSRWKTSFRWHVSKENSVSPADAYEISRRSLVKRVIDVLEKKDSCLVRLSQNLDLKITVHDKNMKIDADALFIALTDKIKVESGETMSTRELEELINTYDRLATATGNKPDVIIEVNANTDDHLFRSTLNAFASDSIRDFRVIIK